MLSYMVPSIEDKPPLVPSKNHLQLNLDNVALPPLPPKLTNGHSIKKIIKTVNGKSVNSVVGTPNMIVTTSAPCEPVNTAAKNAPAAFDGGQRIIKTSTESGNKIIKSTLSTESSASSLSSGNTDVPTTNADRPKPKLLTNGGTKHQSLKRVSFGSSKGSMVETLIYESPLQEEPEISPTAESPGTDSNAGSDIIKVPSKVKVSFFEQEKPLIVNSPEPSETIDDLDAPFILGMTSQSPVPDHAPAYNRQASTDSGWDNPFRPDGDLSREADEIVELIKGGKPITPTPGSTAPKLPVIDGNGVLTPATATPVSQSPVKNANGSTPVSNNKPISSPPGTVELQRATVVPPSDASQVEHVVLKKKPKCKCCVIQ